MSRSQSLRSRFITAAAILCLASSAEAQLSSATVKGKVTANDAAAPAGTSVVAVNKDSGFKYRATTKSDGSYTLTGLPPGEYELRVTGPDGTAKTDVLTLAVGDTASLDLTLDKAKVEEIVVTGVRRKNVKTSEVGTNVAPKVIEALPAATHNFLATADLAPGVFVEQDQGSGFTWLRGGSQARENTNVFIDGVGQKNQILRGGMSGQDSSRGNPFPQSAIAEFKVITSNYKAEFDQVSSAAITAVTKSGTNDLHGSAYYDRTGTALRSKTKFETEREAAGQKLQASGKNEFGASVGGAIQEDVAHYFFAYDGKDISDSRQVVPKNLDSYGPGVGGVVPSLRALGGSFVDPFNEHLLFGKLDIQVGEGKKLTATAKMRFEADRQPENRDLSAHGNDKERTNNDIRFDLVYERNFGSSWLAETRAGYQDALWNPKSSNFMPLMKYKYSSTNLLNSSQDIIFDGGSPDAQRREQSGFSLGQDLTFTGLLDHVFKGGAKVNFMRYDLSGTPRAVDVIETLVDTTTGLPYYQGGACTGTNVINGGNNSDQCKIDKALPAASVNIKNTQIGLFVQDDWAVTSKLELNLGVRWDIETNMLNNDYVTPSATVGALYGADGRTFCHDNPIPGQPRICDVVAPPGQTYAESLAKGGINIGDYVSNGSSRKAYLGALAPRLGFSYDVFGTKNTVLFGGYGRSYDRTMANHTIDELQHNANARGEIWLIRNDMKAPYSDQFSIGVRQAAWLLNLEAAVSQVNAQNQFQWFCGNRDPNGGFYRQNWMDPLWGGPSGWGTLILGDFVGEMKTTQVLLKVEKPYSASSGWAGSMAYTFTDAQTKHNDWNDDMFDWTYGRNDRFWHPARLVDRNQFVAFAMTDRIPFGFTASAKYTYKGDMVRRAAGAPGGVYQFFALRTPALKQLDLSLTKFFRAGPGAITVRADVLNLLNSGNYNQGNDWIGGGAGGNRYGLDGLNISDATSIRGPPRTFKLSGSYSF